MREERGLLFVTVVLTAALSLSTVGCAPPSEDRGTTGGERPSASAAPILPSWADGTARGAITDFVARVTDPADPDFVPEAERIAVFDNDGTLWSEQPMYVQLAFAVDRVKAISAEHPEWRERQPFKGVLEDDLTAVAAAGEHGLLGRHCRLGRCCGLRRRGWRCRYGRGRRSGRLRWCALWCGLRWRRSGVGDRSRTVRRDRSLGFRLCRCGGLAALPA